MNIIKISIAFLLTVALPASAREFEIQHLEPLSWWVGMQHPELQLMVNGENISALTPRINCNGITLDGVDRTDNKNYLFINVRIGESTKPGTCVINFDLDGKTITKFNYQLNARIPNSSKRRGFDAKDAIYLLMPDRFSNENAANDSQNNLFEKANRKISGGRHGGDIAGMQKHLDYIANMGFTMIWPTPLLENNMEVYSYHGYSATDYYQIDKRFGSNQDYKNFVAAANKKGVGVIQDVVLNHIGSNHWWMKDLPSSDWLNSTGSYVETTHRRTTIHDIHASPEDTKIFTDGWFVKTMPDLNQRNPLLAKYLIQNSIWWIEYANLSGIREDTYSYADRSFLAAWGKTILEEYPDFNMVGEEWTPNSAIVSSWQKGKKNEDGYTSYLPSLMDFPVVLSLRNALIDEEKFEPPEKGLVTLYETIANDFQYPDPMHLVVFPENHDTSRIFSVLKENVDLFKSAMIFFATTRGIPQFYYGSEVLLTSPLYRDDGAFRADMPGGWQGDAVNAFTGKGLTEKQIDAQNFIKKLLNWRKNSKAVTEGKLLHYSPENSTYVYFRYTDTQRVMVILNKNSTDTQLDLSRFKTGFNGKKSGHAVLTGSDIDLTKPLLLKAQTSVVIEL